MVKTRKEVNWVWLSTQTLLYAGTWVFAVIHLALHLRTMTFLSAVTWGCVVFVIPFTLWRDIPKIVDGWKART